MNGAPNRSPTSFELGAALWVASVLPPQGGSREHVRASYALIPTGGIYRSEDFLRAEEFLARSGFVECEEHRIFPTVELIELTGLPRDEALEVLLLAATERTPPIWMFTACEGATLAIELIPDADWSVFQAIVPDPARREEFLLALGRKFDGDEAARRGVAGEIYIVERCRAELCRLGRPDLAGRVRHVSTISDQLGYDVVTPTVGGEPWRLEVKTTRLFSGGVRIALSRNEARVGLADERWLLVVCIQHEDNEFHVAGWCRASVLQPILPVDPTKQGIWVSANLNLDFASLQFGLPDLSGRAGN
jgi:uncharacterized protein DUF3883